MGIGILEIIGSAYATEMTPANGRGWYYVCLNFCWFFGALYILGMGFLLIPDLNPTYWRYFVGICVVPSIISFVLSLCLLDESPRYLISKKDYTGAVVVTNKIAITNKQHELTA